MISARLPGSLDLDTLFLFEAKRRVQRDRTVSLNGTLFEVDATLVNHTVTLRFDPGAPPADRAKNRSLFFDDLLDGNTFCPYETCGRPIPRGDASCGRAGHDVAPKRKRKR